MRISDWSSDVCSSDLIDFLASARVVPGTQSGSCLFDFDGSVEQWCRKYTERNAHLDPLGEAFYRIAHDEFLYRFEGNVDYAGISPRHSEAAATRSVTNRKGVDSGTRVAGRVVSGGRGIIEKNK